MDKEQRKTLEAPFPVEEIKSRPGSSGKILNYVEGHSVVRRLNESLAGDWSFEIAEHMLREEEILVVGELRVGDIVKMQVGSSRVTRNRDTGEILSLGEDFKSAVTDCLKKCATLYGIGLHLYGSSSEKEELTQESPRRPASQATENRDSLTRGNLHGQRTGSSSKGRLSQKQHHLILKLATEAGVTREELNRHSQQRHGCVIDFLSKADASKLIEALFAGQIQAA